MSGYERDDFERAVRAKKDADEAAEAIERAHRNAQEEWQERARSMVTTVANAYPESFTADDVWDCGLEQPPNDPRALGGVFRRLAREGLIEKTGRFARSHRRHSTPLIEWRLIA